MADPLRCGGAGIDRCFHRGDVTDELHGDESRVRLLGAEQPDVGRLQAGVGGLDRADEPTGLDQSERAVGPLVNCVT